MRLPESQNIFEIILIPNFWRCQDEFQDTLNYGFWYISLFRQAVQT